MIPDSEPVILQVRKGKPAGFQPGFKGEKVRHFDISRIAFAKNFQNYIDFYEWVVYDKITKSGIPIR